MQNLMNGATLTMTSLELVKLINDEREDGQLSEFKNYRKKNLQPMRPYIPGEDLTGVSVNKEDTPEEGGMIAVNPNNPNDMWYVGKQFFADNYELAAS